MMTIQRLITLKSIKKKEEGELGLNLLVKSKNLLLVGWLSQF